MISFVFLFQYMYFSFSCMTFLWKLAVSLPMVNSWNRNWIYLSLSFQENTNKEINNKKPVYFKPVTCKSVFLFFFHSQQMNAHLHPDLENLLINMFIFYFYWVNHLNFVRQENCFRKHKIKKKHVYPPKFISLINLNIIMCLWKLGSNIIFTKSF